MDEYSVEPTLSSVQQLTTQLERLKLRYKHICQDLRDRTTSQSIVELKKLEREFLVFDMKKLEHLLMQLKSRQKLRPSALRTLFMQLLSRQNLQIRKGGRHARKSIPLI